MAELVQLRQCPPGRSICSKLDSNVGGVLSSIARIYRSGDLGDENGSCFFLYYPS